ncbi:MAG: DEAD/DEAH box helicase family protein [Sandaracinaceae bacterium]|nr:DEAD/DEAH box helicase family protein [Sandaracinaceae bacterium]MBK8407631.1 DEAD/DEAH box helicase family protein [Sandaracinaceae bacterium]
MQERGCFVCEANHDEAAIVVVMQSPHPLARGHAIVAPRRHINDAAEVTVQERNAIRSAIDQLRTKIDQAHAPDGYRVTFDLAPIERATTEHFRVDLVPQYREQEKVPYAALPPLANALVTGASDDPLLPHLDACLARATSFRASVAFVQPSGVELLRQRLRDLLDRGGTVQLVVGDYLNLTDPDALLALMDLGSSSPDRIGLRVYEARDRGFHPKSYLVEAVDGPGVAFVGSSNLSRPALSHSVEWNYRVISSESPSAFADIRAELDRIFRHPATVPLTTAWVAAYRARRTAPPAPPVPYRMDATSQGFVGVADGGLELDGPEVPPEEPTPPPPKTDIQSEALEALEATRREGNRAGLVVLATGLGKTFLAAFDACRPSVGRVLFVAHVDDILRQARDTFRRLRPSANLGFFRGNEKTTDADVVFASVQALSRTAHLNRFARDAFDYIVIDEFHHADASTYRRIIQHFRPNFLLGLTATPERTDGGNLLSLCNENLVFCADMMEGIERGLLCPFNYYGVPDPVDYENIPWRSGKFVDVALEDALAVEERAANALQQLETRGGDRALAFCASIRHADFMSAYFNKHGVTALAVHSGANGTNRVDAIDALSRGSVRIVVTVDMFNEGVDIPQVNTILMLRPTESKIVWLQQIGRGLRVSAGKERLTIIDYVGNHRSFLRSIELIFGRDPGDFDDVFDEINKSPDGSVELPGGCHVAYDLEAVDILRALLTRNAKLSPFDAWVVAFAESTGRRPTAVEAFHAGQSPGALPKRVGTWFEALQAVEKRRRVSILSASEALALSSESSFALLRFVATLPTPTSYELLSLEAWLGHERWPERVHGGDLVASVQERGRAIDPVSLDLSVDVDDRTAVESVVLGDTIPKLVAAASTAGVSVIWNGEFLEFGGEVDTQLTETLREMAAELIAWQLAALLHRRRSDRFTQIRDESGAAIDARFTVERAAGGYSVFIESRGGTTGSDAARNTKYADGLSILLRRLARLRAVITTVELATQRVSGEQLVVKNYEYPIKLSAIDDHDALRRAIQNAQGNNPTRRIRIQLAGITDASLARVHRRLALGD